MIWRYVLVLSLFFSFPPSLLLLFVDFLQLGEKRKTPRYNMLILESN